MTEPSTHPTFIYWTSETPKSRFTFIKSAIMANSRSKGKSGSSSSSSKSNKQKYDDGRKAYMDLEADCNKLRQDIRKLKKRTKRVAEMKVIHELDEIVSKTPTLHWSPDLVWSSDIPSTASLCMMMIFARHFLGKTSLLFRLWELLCQTLLLKFNRKETFQEQWVERQATEGNFLGLIVIKVTEVKLYPQSQTDRARLRNYSNDFLW